MSISDISFDEDDDFSMDFKPDFPVSSRECKDDNRGKTSLQALSLEEANRKYLELQRQMKEVDEVATQLKFALELRVKMEECSSSRIDSGSLINTHYEVRTLANESLILLFHIKNNSSQALSDWYFIVNYQSLDVKGCSSSHTFCLSYLEPEQTRSFEVFLAKATIDMPILVRSKLVRCFDFSQRSRMIRISLDRDIISLLNFMKYISADDIEKKSSFGSFTFTVPSSLMNLLSGCPDNVKPRHFLNFVLGTANFSSALNLSEDQTVANCSIDLFHNFHQIRIEVEKEFKSFKITVYAKDSTIRRNLQRDFMLLVVARSSEILNRPPNQTIEWSAHNERTINDVFLNIIERFS